MKKAQTIWSFHPARLLLLLGFALLLTACSDRQVATVPNDSEANEIINILHQNEIEAVKEPTLVGQTTMYQISVHGDVFGESSDYNNAVQILGDNCLPMQDPAAIESAGMIPNVDSERAKIERQVAIKIVRQLRQLPGVTCVYVTFVAPETAITINPYPSTASVVINYKNETPSFTDQEIKELVAGSVAKLKPEAVTVKSVYNPVHPIQKSNRSNVGRFIVIGGAGLLIILGSVFLVYFLQRRRNSSTALEVQPEDFEEIETVD